MVILSKIVCGSMRIFEENQAENIRKEPMVYLNWCAAFFILHQITLHQKVTECHNRKK